MKAPALPLNVVQQRPGKRCADAERQQRIALALGADAVLPAFQRSALAVVVTVGGFALEYRFALADILARHDEKFACVPAGRCGRYHAILWVLRGDVLADLGAALVVHIQAHAQQNGQDRIGLARQ